MIGGKVMSQGLRLVCTTRLCRVAGCIGGWLAGWLAGRLLGWALRRRFMVVGSWVRWRHCGRILRRRVRIGGLMSRGQVVEVGLLSSSSNQLLSSSRRRAWLPHHQIACPGAVAFASDKLPRKTARRYRRWYCVQIVVDVIVPRPCSGCQVLRQPPTSCQQCMLLTRIVTKFDT